MKKLRLWINDLIKASNVLLGRVYPKKCVSIETQTGDVTSAEYVDSGVETNDDLFVMVANKGTENDSECHQLIGTLRETISLLTT